MDSDSYKSKTLKMFEQAKQNKDIAEISEAYFYVCPRRYNLAGDVTKEVYDATAIKALRRRTDDLHGQLYPPFRQWINLIPATLIPDQYEQDWQKYKDEAEKKMSLALEVSNFHIEVDDPITDSLISEGALLLHEGTPECPFIFEAVSWDKFFTIDSYDKRPLTNFLLRKLKLGEIKYRWPDAGLDDLKTTDDKTELEIVDAIIYDDVKDTYNYEVWSLSPEVMIFHKDNLSSSPWNIFRFTKRMTTGQGYGPVKDIIPDIKTANKVEELVLKNASIAVTGIWQADDDGIINPKTIKLVPGTIIPKAVGSKGLQALETPRIFDVSQVVLDDLRNSIKEQILGASMPDPNSGIRTAYELSERKAEAAKSEVPLTLKLAQTNDCLIKRMYSILTSPSMLASPYHLKKFTFTAEGENIETEVKVKAANPLVDLQTEVDSQRSLQALAGCQQIFGQMPMLLIEQADYARAYLLDNGFDVRFLKNEKDGKAAIAEYQEQQKQAQIQQAMEEQAKNGN